MPKLLLAAVLLAQISPDLAGGRQFRDLIRMVDDVAAGRPGPIELTPQVQFHFLRAKDGKAYVPMAILLPEAQDTVASLDVLVRGVPEDTQRAEIVPLEPIHGREAHRPSMRTFPIEGGGLVRMEPVRSFALAAFDSPSSRGSGRPAGAGIRGEFAFAAPPGRYIVYIAMRERTTHKPRAGVLKRTIDVPDFTAGGLAVSSVIVADRLIPLPQAAKKPQPYTLGTLAVVPSFDRQFSVNESVAIVLLVYNASRDAFGKPDVVAEFAFFRTDANGETVGIRTKPQELTPATLPAGFDLTRGDQLVAGQEVPLESFTPGEYHVEVRVTDRATGRTAIGQETFRVKR